MPSPFRTCATFAAERSDAIGPGLTLKETPGTVNVITADLLRDLGVRKITDVLGYVPGVTQADNGGTPGDSITIRGFATGSYFNGMRQAVTTQQARSLKNIDRVEIVKGPAGFEAAISEPGGFANFITKKPQAEFALVGEVGIGDYGWRSASIDVTGPVAALSGLSYRLIAAHDELASWRPGRQKRPQDLLSPSLLLDYAEGSRVLIEWERLKSNDPLDRGTLYLRGAGFADDFAGRHWAVHQAIDSTPALGERADFEWTHRLNTVFSATLRAQDYRQDVTNANFGGGETEGDALYAADGLTWNGSTRNIPIYFETGGTKLRAKTLQGSLRADVAIGATGHVFIAGLGRNKGSDRFLYNGNSSGAPNVGNTVDLFAPNNAQAPQFTGTEFVGDYVRGSTVRSGFGQWVGKWTPALRTVLSVRRDHYRDFFREDTLDGSPPTFAGGTEDKLTSWRAALSYDLSSRHTAFVGFSNSFIPQGAIDRNGRQIDALRARAIEAGVKSSFAGGKLLWTNTLYTVKQDNFSACDTDPSLTQQQIADCVFSVPFGSVRARGFESEVSGKPLPDLELSAGLAWQDAKISKSTDGFDGNRFANAPRAQLSVFANYRWAPLGLPQLSTRLGAYRVGSRFGNSGNTVVLPAYTRVDGGLGWAFTPRLSLALNIENLLDTTYYTAMQDSGTRADQVGVGNRRLMQLVLRAAY
jgi:iron complex outermembrane recepter protein